MKKILICFVLLIVAHFVEAQSTVTILTVHPIVGDTIDEFENQKYQLFDNFNSSQFRFAVYLMENHKIDVKLKSKRGDSLLLDYDSKKMLDDYDKIASHNFIPTNDKLEQKKSKNIKGYFTLNAGVWLPIGGTLDYTPHPCAGYQMGIFNTKFSLGFEANVQYGQLTKSYPLLFSNNIYSETHDFKGGYLGIYGVIPLYRNVNHTLNLISAIGIEGCDMYDYNLRVVYESTTVGCVNMGFEYRFNLNNMRFFGIQIRYTYMYNTLFDTSILESHLITTSFEFGGLLEKRKKKFIKKIG